MLAAVTRLVVAAGYAALTVWVVRVVPQLSPPLRASFRFLAAATGIWSGWYVFLAVADPPIYPWGSLNRALHLPLIAAIGTVVWASTRRREPSDDA